MSALMRHVSDFLTPYSEETWRQLKQGIQFSEFCSNSLVKAAYYLVHEQLGITDPAAVNLIFAALISVWLGLCIVILVVITAPKSRRSPAELQVALPELNSALPVAEASCPEPSTPSTEPVAPTSPTSGAGRIFDFDKFMWRMHDSVVVHRIKQKEKKYRCMKISDDCELKLYKLYRVDHGNISALGPSYLRLPLGDLLDCLEADSSQRAADRSIILEFQSKCLQVSGSAGIDTNQLLRGFRYLTRKVKEDKRFLDIWRSRFREKRPSNVVATPQKSPAHSTPIKTPNSAQSLGSTSSSQQSSYYSFGKKKTKLL